MTTCKQCGCELSEGTEEQYRALDFQNGREIVSFCSRECLYEWVQKKRRGMTISLVIGGLISILYFFSTAFPIGADEGLLFALITSLFGGLELFFLPYCIRRLWKQMKDKAEILVVLALLVAGVLSATFLFPIIWLCREKRHYNELEDEYWRETLL